MNSKLENLKLQFKNAYEKFADVMQQKKDEYIRDSAIQRFEFTFELAWKTIKAHLEEKGIRVDAPKDAIREAFRIGLIGDDPTWLEMIKTRNLTSHVYNEAMAEKVYSSFSLYLPLLKKLVDELS